MRPSLAAPPGVVQVRVRVHGRGSRSDGQCGPAGSDRRWPPSPWWPPAWASPGVAAWSVPISAPGRRCATPASSRSAFKPTSPAPATGSDANVSVAAPPSENDVRDVASVVWNHVHQRFSLLTVTVKGTGSGQGQVLRRPYTFSQLEALFGARNPAWNQNTLSQAAERLGFAILGGIVVVIVGIAVIAVVIARRRRRLELASGGPTGPRPTGVPLWAPPSGPPPPAEWSPPPSGWSGSDPGWSPNPSPPSPAGPWPAGGPSPPPVPAGSWPDGGPSASVRPPHHRQLRRRRPRRPPRRPPGRHHRRRPWLRPCRRRRRPGPAARRRTPTLTMTWAGVHRALRTEHEQPPGAGVQAGSLRHRRHA